MEGTGSPTGGVAAVGGIAPEQFEGIDVATRQLLGESFGGGVAFDGLGYFQGFGVFVVQAHEGRGVTNVLRGLFVLFDEDFQVAQIATDTLVTGLGVEVADLGCLRLAIAIHTAVALLEHHQRPGDVEVDQPVRLVVQVQTFGSHVGGDEQAQRRMAAAKVLDCLLNVLIGQLAVQDGNGVRLQAQRGRQVSFQEFQGFDALGEEHQAVIGGTAVPAPMRVVLELGDEMLQLTELRRFDLLHKCL